MRKFIIVMLIIPFIFSCENSSKKLPGTDFNFSKTSIATLKEYYRTDLENPYNFDARVIFQKKHKDEVLKTLEVVEEVEVEKDIFLIFYRYSIGTDIVKKTQYLRKMDGLYYPFYKYYSTYNNDDPFKNGKGEQAKLLLAKAVEWDKNENIWWDR